MTLSRAKSRLGKIEETARAEREKFVTFPMSNLEMAARVLYLWETRPEDENTKRIWEILGEAARRKEASDRGETP